MSSPEVVHDLTVQGNKVICKINKNIKYKLRTNLKERVRPVGY